MLAKRLYLCAIIGLTCYLYGINGTFVTCNRDYLKIGCFKNTKYLNTLLLNDRDPGSPTFSGFMIQWGNLGKSLHSLACRCAEKARREGYTHISIRFFAECWAGRGWSTFDLLRNAQRSKDCLQDRYEPCSKHYGSGECTGTAKDEYIYEVVTTKITNNEIDGGWSTWSDWTACSVTCGEGEQARERVCNNPEPTSGGEPCKGTGTEAKICNNGKCAAIADSTGHLECEKRIKGLYLAILHRQPEKEGFVWHLNNCKKHGYTYKMSFGSINNSKERKDILCRELIDHLYKGVLKKAPDSDYNDIRMQCFNGRSTEMLVADFLKREDYLNYDHTKYPTVCHQRVLGLHRALLHDEKVMTHFETYFEECNAGASIASQARKMMATPERKAMMCKIRVNFLYNDVLRRSGEEAGLSHHIHNCVRGRSYEDQVNDFIYSAEFEVKYRGIEPEVTSINKI